MKKNALQKHVTHATYSRDAALAAIFYSSEKSFLQPENDYFEVGRWNASYREFFNINEDYATTPISAVFVVEVG